MSILSHRLALLGSITTLAIGGLTGTALAKHGADDPANHNKADDNGGKVVRVVSSDDPVGHDRNDDKGRRFEKRHHRRHRHHARAHAARRGADDGPNHDKGDDKGGR
jgi:hypothetical protein